MKVSDDVLKSIGQLTLKCTELEIAIELGIWMLVGNRGPIVTAHMSNPHKINTLLALVDSAYPESDGIHETLTKELNRAQKLFGKRNKMVHSTWDEQDGVSQYVERSARSRWKLQSVPKSSGEIDQVASEVDESAKRLWTIYLESGILPQPSLDK